MLCMRGGGEVQEYAGTVVSYFLRVRNGRNLLVEQVV